MDGLGCVQKRVCVCVRVCVCLFARARYFGTASIGCGANALSTQYKLRGVIFSPFNFFFVVLGYPPFIFLPPPPPPPSFLPHCRFLVWCGTDRKPKKAKVETMDGDVLALEMDYM